QHNFPKIFNNFTRTNNAKQDKASEPAPYTVVQSFAARLRYNQSKTEIPIVLNDLIHTTRQGYPAVLLDEHDYYVKLAECCKYTLVGKFINTMPKMELPIVLIWVVVLGLPWHCYNKVLSTTILESVGKVLYLDSPTSQRTRGSTTRVKVQVDLTNKSPEHVWLGFKNSDPNKGRWLKVQYEGIPDYCMYCKHQGHMDYDCTIKRRDEDVNRRKEMESEKKTSQKEINDKVEMK
ncbi:hypothetical protein EJD97_016049, partial [Solanum chilense]